MSDLTELPPKTPGKSCCLHLSYHSAGRNQEGWYRNWAECAKRCFEYDEKCPSACRKYQSSDVPAWRRRQYHE